MDWNGILNLDDPQRNLMMQVGLGLLAGNQSGNPAMGAMRGFQNAQELQNAMQRQKFLEEEAAQRQEEFAWRKAEAERAAKAPIKVGNTLLDPVTMKPVYTDTSPSSVEYGLVPQIGLNPNTGKPEKFVQDKSGNTKWLGIATTLDELKTQEMIDAGIIPPTNPLFGRFQSQIGAGVQQPQNNAPQSVPVPSAMPYTWSGPTATDIKEGTSPTMPDLRDPAKPNLAPSLTPKGRRDLAQKQAESEIVTPPQQAEMDEKARKAEEEKQKKLDRTKLALGKADIVIGKVQEALDQVGSSTSGAFGSLLQDSPLKSSIVDMLGGGNAYDLNKTIQTIKSNIGFQELQAMRDASPTGGALGQVAVQELENLQSTLASLDQGQSPSKLAENLRKVKKHFEAWKATLNGQLPKDAQMTSGNAVAELPKTAKKGAIATDTVTGAKFQFDGMRWKEIK